MYFDIKTENSKKVDLCIYNCLSEAIFFLPKKGEEHKRLQDINGLAVVEPFNINTPDGILTPRSRTITQADLIYTKIRLPRNQAQNRYRTRHLS
jgi:hypothetical protein